MISANEIRQKWPPRKSHAHKGDFGRVLVIAGSQGMSGAAELCGMAALRTGAGLVTVAVPDAVYSVIARKFPDLMVKPMCSTSGGSLSLRCAPVLEKMIETQDVIAVGPGLSRNTETQRLIRRIILKSKRPVVLDADGLNAFVNRSRDLLKSAGKLVMTPHPGEFVRLFGGKLEANDALRTKRAAEAALKTKAVIVLKGHRTVIAEGRAAEINPTGNPGMAKAGFGDILTGMIAALLAQGFSGWDAAKFGVFIHGMTADSAAKRIGEASLIASDLLGLLPEVIKKIRKI